MTTPGYFDDFAILDTQVLDDVLGLVGSLCAREMPVSARESIQYLQVDV